MIGVRVPRLRFFRTPDLKEFAMPQLVENPECGIREDSLGGIELVAQMADGFIVRGRPEQDDAVAP
jgi:hypothetical protein